MLFLLSCAAFLLPSSTCDNKETAYAQCNVHQRRLQCHSGLCGDADTDLCEHRLHNSTDGLRCREGNDVAKVMCKPPALLCRYTERTSSVVSPS